MDIAFNVTVVVNEPVPAQEDAEARSQAYDLQSTMTSDPPLGPDAPFEDVVAVLLTLDPVWLFDRYWVGGWTVTRPTV